MFVCLNTLYAWQISTIYCFINSISQYSLLVPFLERDQLSTNNLIYTKKKHKVWYTRKQFGRVFLRQSMGDETGTVPSDSLVLDFPSRRWKPPKIKAKCIYSDCLKKISLLKNIPEFHFIFYLMPEAIFYIFKSILDE